MKQVKIFVNESRQELEKEINKWLEECNDFTNIIDIKFVTTYSEDYYYGILYAMVIYEIGE